MIVFRPKPAQLVEGCFPGGVFTRSGLGLQKPTLGGIRASEQMIYSLTFGGHHIVHTSYKALPSMSDLTTSTDHCIRITAGGFYGIQDVLQQ